MGAPVREGASETPADQAPRAETAPEKETPGSHGEKAADHSWKSEAPRRRTTTQMAQVGLPPGAEAHPADARSSPVRTSTGTHELTTAEAPIAPTQTLTGLERAQRKLSGAMAKPERPPDAYQILRDAREAGVLFTEDALAEGHSEDTEDPDMVAAVEECIRLCFGVPGILRIGPGKNDRGESVIVVVATHGFSETSLARVPAQVHRFFTLVAIPFDLLPLRRER